jgi:hypothetical protein
MSDTPAPNGNLGDRILLNGRFDIQPDQPLPMFDSPMAKAVNAIDLRASSRTLFALVCEPTLMARLDVIPPLSRMVRQPMINPVDAGPVHWPRSGGRRFVIVFEQMSGGRLIPSPEATITPMREDQIVRVVLEPLLPALKELNGRHIPHRAIRTDNIFYADTSEQSVVLGECVSGPPGLSQPAVCEPIDTAMCDPAGRGPGTLADDLYALGVVAVFLLHGGNPVAERSDEEIMRRKIDNGSYAALLSGMRVSLAMMEPLRGMLCDDPKERWTAANLEMWLGGRQLSPKQTMLPPRAARSFSFAGKDYRTRQSLSQAMGWHWDEAGELVRSGDLEGWIRRSLADDERADAIRDCAHSSGVGNEDQALGRVLMVIEPSHPIRFKNFAARVEGIGTALAIRYHDPAFRALFTELMQAKLPQTFIQSQSSTPSESGVIMKSFDMINFFIDRPQLGGGLERALYESVRGWPCQSPLIQDYYVSDLEDLLPALEAVAQRGGMTGEPVDPHITAFCAARNKSVSERALKEMNSRGDLPSFRLGVLRLLAEVQRKIGSGQRYPALGRWLADLIKPIVETYHNRAYRAKLVEEIENASGKGDLLELLFLADSMEARDQDTGGFQEARKEHAALVRGIKWLEDGGLTSEAHVRAKGQSTATIVSAVVSGLMVVGLTLIYVT